ncbi:DUF1134 domain-containing protein [Hyphomicrobium sp.]|uniref:DUF1134 domain-containing protein n=1 Tax=Hyphomicrobium sp. TaxID=82 RepID=UPI002D7952B9|nr:DUF1134 domain-containing protein [Hyphomicrobium sp.]HET6389881.1 DUF1134 domain-containing protein [Hyphomicrobium sp.]
MRLLPALIILAAALAAAGSAEAAETCTTKDFAAAIDQSGASLRALTLEAQPKLQERMQRYRAALKLSETDYEEAALDAIQDPALEEFDKKSSALLLKVDSLGRVPEGVQPDCAKLREMRAAAEELNGVIKGKSDLMLKRLDEKIAQAERSGQAPKPAASAAAPAKPATQAPPPSPADVASQNPIPATPKAKKPEAPQTVTKAPLPPVNDWAASTKHEATPPPPVVAMKQPDHGTDAYPLPPNTAPPLEQGYTIDEIRDATQGFFGTISTNLASVIEHAFKEFGRPTAYILGIEGGGAFLAGLRYGQGSLFMRSQSGIKKVYWHGPSLGTDLGASGSRTLFLIYNMNEPSALFRNFTGIDGSAYFVGGVGLTVLKGGPVIMAPIRSGVGMRLGASLGYLGFTETPTWNPF